MRLSLAIGLTALLVLTAGCGPRSGSNDVQTAARTADAQSPAPTSGTEAVPAPTPATAPVGQEALWFEPTGLSACARPQAIVVHWDAHAFPGVKTVQIVAVNPAGKESIFLLAGSKGSKETGPWMRAQAVMLLRNKADGAELAKATVASIPCN